MEGGGGHAQATQGPGVALTALAVIEEPSRPGGDHTVPAVGLAFQRAVARPEALVEVEGFTVPDDPEDAGVTHDVDPVPVRRETSDRRLGQHQARRDVESGRIENEQLSGLALVRRHMHGGTGAAEVLGHQVAVGQRDEAVVRALPGQAPAGSSRWA